MKDNNLDFQNRDQIFGISFRSVNALVGAARAIVKKLRTPHIVAVIRRRKALLPIVDNATRWSSTSAMLARLLELRPVVEDLGAANTDLHMSSIRWKQLEEIAEVLNEPAVCTQRLQAADLTPGAFWKEWMLLKRRLRSNGSPLAIAIASSLETREKKLCECGLFLAAVYVDMRYRLLLEEADMWRGEKEFHKVVKREAQIRGQGEDDTVARDEPEERPESSSTEDELEQDLDRMQEVAHKELTMRRQSPSLQEDFEKVRLLPRMKTKTAFDAINSFPQQLQSAALALTAMPVTQVSVERLFSALRFIVSDSRASMKQDLVEAILLLRTNS